MPGVERVMGYCTERAAERFLQDIPHQAALLIQSGLTILEYFLTVGEEEQERRFRRRSTTRCAS
jgi:polyphosphate kinase 2 (PPK2 family)